MRNRAWILPRYLQALDALEFPPEYLSFHFIVNDSSDESWSLLVQWMSGRRGCVDSVNFGERPSDTAGAVRLPGPRQQTYPILAELRNQIVERCVADDVDWLFSVDTDVLVTPESLLRLLSAERDVVAALIKNGAGPFDHNYLHYDEIQDRHVRYRVAPCCEVFEVGLTGAVCLYSRRALAVGRFAPHDDGGVLRGEDEGMARSLRAAGITQWVDGGTRCEHMLEGP